MPIRVLPLFAISYNTNSINRSNSTAKIMTGEGGI